MRLTMGLIFLGVFAFSTATFAAAGKPCKKLANACQAAGYTKANHKKKRGLRQDCMRPLLDGATVPGVTVAAADVQACKANKAQHHKR